MRLRWDRVGRVALVLVLLAVLGLYIGPAWSYFSTWREAGARHAELHRLRTEHARLLAEQRSLSQPATLLRKAREMGMVRRGERPFVVTGLPTG